MRLLNGVTKDDKKKKINIYKICNFKKGRTDIAGHLNDYDTVRSQSNRWDLVAFFLHYCQFEVETHTFNLVKELLQMHENTLLNLFHNIVDRLDKKIDFFFFFNIYNNDLH